MKDTIRITYRILNEVGFRNNRYLQRSLRLISDQVSLLRESEALHYDMEGMGFLDRGRFIFSEPGKGADELLLGEAEQTQGLVQTMQLELQPTIQESAGQPDLAISFHVRHQQRAYSMNGCDLVWGKSDWEYGVKKRSSMSCGVVR